MKYLCELVSAKPLVIHFSLLNPPGSNEPVFVPRVLGPYGLFVRVTIKNSGGQVVLEPPAIRGTFKLDPGKASSYMALDPGYSFGAAFEIDDAPEEPGDYRVFVEYANKPYTGAPGAPVPRLGFKGELELVVPG